MKTKFFTLFFVLIASLGTLFAQSGTCGTNLTWTLNDSVLTISGTGAMQKYSSSSRAPWYTYRESIKEIILQEGLTSIGQCAFEYCSNVKSVEIPNTVTSIGYAAFCVCSNLTSVTIPSSVRSIGDNAFFRCSIKSVYLSDLASWCKIDNYQYGTPMQGGADLYLNGNIVEHLVIPNNVSSIGKYAFEGCRSLKTVTIGNNVTSIGKFVFSRCENLTSVTISDGINKISEGAFLECGNMASINIPNSVISIENRAFSNCSSLPFITIPDGVTSIGYSAFFNCSSLYSIIIPNSITKLENSTFSGCSNLASVTLPIGLTSLGEYVFEKCSSLTSVEIPNSVTSIGRNCFYNCFNIISIGLPSTVSSIGIAAFRGCTSLVSIELPNITSLEEYTFGSCSSLTMIEIPMGVTSIGGSAFDGCSSLTNIVIPNSVTNIGNYAFNGCSNLSNIHFIGSLGDWCESVVPSQLMRYWAGGNLYMQDTLLTRANIPNGITSIKDYTFYKCTDITSVTIPQSVTSIGKYAFSNCSILDSLALYCRLDSVVNNTFSNSKNISYLAFVFTDSIPTIKTLFSSSFNKSIKEIELLPGSTCCGTAVGGNNHLPFMGNKVLEKVTIPANIAVIPDSCFMNCTKLRDVKIGLIDAEGDSITAYAPIKHMRKTHITVTTDIGARVFQNNTSLTSIDFAQGVRSIGVSACENLQNLKHIQFANTVETIDENAFAGCGLEELTLPASITSIGYAAFANNTEITTLNMYCSTEACKQSTTDDNYNQFSGCTNLYTVNLVMSTTIETPWINIPALPQIFSPEVMQYWKNLTFLKGSTFVKTTYGAESGIEYPMPNLQTLKFANTIKLIGDGSFYGCTQLNKVDIPHSVEKIGSNVFKNSGLETITIGNGLREIPSNFCMNSYKLKSIHYGLSLSPVMTKIGHDAFANCTALSFIEIRGSITEIGEDAFSGCSNVKEIQTKAKIPPTCITSAQGAKPFRGITNLQKFECPSTSWSAYSNANVWQDFFYAGKAYSYNLEIVNTQIGQAYVSCVADANAHDAEIVFATVSGNVFYAFLIKNESTGGSQTYEFKIDITTGQPVLAPAQNKKEVENTIPAYKFTINGLTANTDYSYTITAYNENLEILEEFVGTFTTLEEEGTKIGQITNDQIPTTNKILRNGQILIIRGDKTYTLTGQEAR